MTAIVTSTLNSPLTNASVMTGVLSVEILLSLRNICNLLTVEDSVEQSGRGFLSRGNRREVSISPEAHVKGNDQSMIRYE